MPPPIISRGILINKAMEHKTRPAILIPLFSWEVATAIMLISRPMPANGITNQLSHPRKGINPRNMPPIARIPKTKLATFISISFHLGTFSTNLILPNISIVAVLYTLPLTSITTLPNVILSNRIKDEGKKAIANPLLTLL